MFKQKIIFIIGMHRCGTSLLSNCLVKNGWSIGKSVNKDKDWQNPNGYFENDVLGEFHNQLLYKNNSDWLNINTSNMKYTNNDINKYRELLKKEFGNHDKILIKDPRLTFFTNFIKDVNKEQKYDIYFIFCTRNIKECCESLSKAQKKDIDKVLLLYKNTMSCYSDNYLLINHQDIIKNNTEILNTISKYCNFKLKMNTEHIVDLNLYRCRQI